MTKFSPFTPCLVSRHFGLECRETGKTSESKQAAFCYRKFVSWIQKRRWNNIAHKIPIKIVFTAICFFLSFFSKGKRLCLSRCFGNNTEKCIRSHSLVSRLRNEKKCCTLHQTIYTKSNLLVESTMWLKGGKNCLSDHKIHAPLARYKEHVRYIFFVFFSHESEGSVTSPRT